MLNAFSVDVEDYFQVGLFESAIPRDQWGRFEPRVERNTRCLLELCEEHGVPVDDGWGPGKLVLELYEKTTEHALVGPIFVCDYPVEVSPLAHRHRSDLADLPGQQTRQGLAKQPRPTR